jgi:hypothetical protein
VVVELHEILLLTELQDIHAPEDSTARGGPWGEEGAASQCWLRDLSWGRGWRSLCHTFSSRLPLLSDMVHILVPGNPSYLRLSKALVL